MSKIVKMPFDEYIKMEKRYISEIEELYRKKRELVNLINENMFIISIGSFSRLTDPSFELSKEIISCTIESNKDFASQAKKEFINIFKHELLAIDKQYNKIKSELNQYKDMNFWKRFKFLFIGE